jgi:hypothetical protein
MTNEPSNENYLLMTPNADAGCCRGGTVSFTGRREKG